jgi:hypothetical protein
MPKSVTVPASSIKVEGDNAIVNFADDAVFLPEDIEAGYIPKDRMNTIVQERLSRATKGLVKPEALLEDEDFRSRALETWGVKPGEGGVDEATLAEKLSARLRDERSKWERDELGPTTELVQSQQSMIGRLLSKRAEAEIIAAAAAAGIRPEFLKKDARGRYPIVALVESNFDYDHETDSIAIVDGYDEEENPTFKLSTKGTKEMPYLGVGDFFSDFEKDPTNAVYFNDTRQRVDGPRGGAGGARGGVHRISREDASNHQLYKQAQEAARQAGAQLVVDEA